MLLSSCNRQSLGPGARPGPVEPFLGLFCIARKLGDLALRAVAWKQLFDPVLPGIFLAWAKRTDIAVPAELIEAVQKRGVQVADWKALYGEAMDLRKREAKAAESQIADWKRLHDKGMTQLDKEHSQWLKLSNEKMLKSRSLKRASHR